MRIKKSALIPLHLRVSKSARPSSKRGQWASMSFFSFRDVTLTATKPSDSRRVTLTATSASDSRIQIQTYIQRKQFLCVIRTTVARHKQKIAMQPAIISVLVLKFADQVPNHTGFTYLPSTMHFPAGRQPERKYLILQSVSDWTIFIGLTCVRRSAQHSHWAEPR